MTFSTGITLRAMKGIVQNRMSQLQHHATCWPEANVLISRRADPMPVAPGYTAKVGIEKSQVGFKNYPGGVAIISQS
jgi:hypothetical protein